MNMHEKIIHELTKRDRAEQRRAIKSGRHFNHYALSIEFRAAQEMRDAVAAGADLVA